MSVLSNNALRNDCRDSRVVPGPGVRFLGEMLSESISGLAETRYHAQWHGPAIN